MSEGKASERPGLGSQAPNASPTPDVLVCSTSLGLLRYYVCQVSAVPFQVTSGYPDRTEPEAGYKLQFIKAPE